MSWKSPVRGSTSIACYRDPDLNGKRVKIYGYTPSLDDLGPPHLLIPEGHTGTLTGLVKFASFAYELPPDVNIPIECIILVEVHWDDIDRWHHQFCGHGKKTYRYPCLIDLFMDSYEVPPNFLFFIDPARDKMRCVEEHLRNYVTITSVAQDPLVHGSVHQVSIR
ncbi:MAG: hypothetical protein AAB968_01310 [Patescibacteria group bacterium]